MLISVPDFHYRLIDQEAGKVKDKTLIQDNNLHNKVASGVVLSSDTSVNTLNGNNIYSTGTADVQ